MLNQREAGFVSGVSQFLCKLRSLLRVPGSSSQVVSTPEHHKAARALEGRRLLLAASRQGLHDPFARGGSGSIGQGLRWVRSSQKTSCALQELLTGQRTLR